MLVPLLPSVMDTSSIAIWGGRSLSIMVTVLWASVRVTLLGLDRLTVKASSNSSVISPVTSTSMVLEVSPGAKAIVPFWAI